MGNKLCFKKKGKVEDVEMKGEERDLNEAVNFVKNAGKAGGSKVELTMACENLPNLDTISLTDPMVVVYLENNNGIYDEYARTEAMKDSLNPKFTRTCIVIYQFEKKQNIRFDAYDIDDFKTKNPDLINLEKQDYIGSAFYNIHEILGGEFQTLKKQLINEKVPELPKDGHMIVHAEEVEQNNSYLNCYLGVRGIDSRTKIFLKVYRYMETGEYAFEYESKSMNNSSITLVEFPVLQMNIYDLCRGDEDRPIKFDVCEWGKFGRHKFKGYCNISLRDIKQMRTETELKHKETKLFNKTTYVGNLYVIHTEFAITYTFLDYVFGGCNLQLIIGIDFTNSNRPPTEVTSLHHISRRGGELNSYEQAISTVGEILQYYDSDNMLPAFGFGAKLPPFYDSVSHCFALNGNIFQPENYKIDEVLKTYRHIVPHLKFYGPTVFHEIIKFVVDMAEATPIEQEDQNYYILLVITDGMINDLQQTKDEIVRASAFPVSLIIVGVGDADFTPMEELDGDDGPVFSKKLNKEWERDVVQFVPFDVYKGKPSELAKATLTEVPEQKHGLLPKNHKQLLRQAFKKGSKKVHKKDIVSNKIDTGDIEDVHPHFQTIKNKFIEDLIKIGFPRKGIQKIVAKGLPALDHYMASQIHILSKSNNANTPNGGQMPITYETNASDEDEDNERKVNELNKTAKEIEEKEKLSKFLPKFVYKLPWLAPLGFIPTGLHKKYCKICYERKINIVKTI